MAGKTNKSIPRSLLIKAAIKGAENAGYAMARRPGRGLSSIYDASRDGKTRIASIRTTVDRWFGFVPLDKGARWKTLENADLVLVSAVNKDSPQNVDVYLFPADAVRKRFDEAYAARLEGGLSVGDGFGMWVKLDRASNAHAGRPLWVGAGLAADYPAIAQFSTGELEGNRLIAPESAADARGKAEDADGATHTFATVGSVLTWARSEIAKLSGVSSSAIRLDLKIEG